MPFEYSGKEKERSEPERPLADEDLLSDIGESTDYSGLELVELEALLADAIQMEDYQRAATLRDEIQKRKMS